MRRKPISCNLRCSDIYKCLTLVVICQSAESDICIYHTLPLRIDSGPPLPSRTNSVLSPDILVKKVREERERERWLRYIVSNFLSSLEMPLNIHLKSYEHLMKLKARDYTYT